MNKFVISLFVMMLIFGGIFSIATSSIAIECYNTYSEIKESKQNNFTFLVVNLVSAIFTILIASSLLYMVKTD